MEDILEKILAILVKLFSAVSEKTKNLPSVVGGGKSQALKKHRNYKALMGAVKELGTKEVVGAGNNKRIVKYHAYSREDNDTRKGLADSVPWCSSFCNFVLEYYAGMGSPNSMAARSYLKWGVSTKKKPLPGDLVVYWRGSKTDWRGHVGFYLDETENFIYTLGGNQGDAVTIARYHKSKLLDIRRSSRAKPLSEPDQDRLWSIAEGLISGKKLDTSGKLT